MQILVRHNHVIDYCSDATGYINTGSTVICPSKSCNFDDCEIVTVNAIPDDLDQYHYYYEFGKFYKGEKKSSDIGRSLEGKVVSPTYDTTKTAGTGAEIFNDLRNREFTNNYDPKASAGNVASGYYSHAEGNSTTASGDYSHAEGIGSTASGGYGAHAEGNDTEASGLCSHAEGSGTTASGLCSHAEGDGTIASGDNQHVQGKYNVEDSNGTYAHILGKGSSASSRSNAHTVDWSGNAWFAGDVYVGGENKDTGSKKLAIIETGTWTPTCSLGTLGDVTANYTRVGPFVYLFLKADMPSPSDNVEGSTVFTIGNYPYKASHDCPGKLIWTDITTYAEAAKSNLQPNFFPVIETPTSYEDSGNKIHFYSMFGGRIYRDISKNTMTYVSGNKILFTILYTTDGTRADQ